MIKYISSNRFEIAAITLLILMQSITEPHVIQVFVVLFIYFTFTFSKVYKKHKSKMLGNESKTIGEVGEDDDDEGGA